MSNNTNSNGNLNIGITSKARFTVDGDINKVIEFDPSDVYVVNRLSESMSKLSEITEKWISLMASTSNQIANFDNVDDAMKSTKDFSACFKAYEKEMRDTINYIFDGDIADTLLGNASSFSPINGKFKYEHLIEKMLDCYDMNIKSEVPQFNRQNIYKHTHSNKSKRNNKRKYKRK